MGYVMGIEELTWKVLKREVKIDAMDSYTLYYIYSIMIALKQRLISAREKYPEELQPLKPIIELVDELIENIYPRVKDMDICYAVLESSEQIAKAASKRIFGKIVRKIAGNQQSFLLFLNP